MIRRRFLIFGFILAGIVMAGLAPPARADFQVKFDYGGASILLDSTTGTTTASGGASKSGASIDYSTPGMITITNLVVSDNGTTGGFKINATVADSNSPGADNVATIDLSSLTIKNQTGVAGNSLLTITTGDTGFNQPLGNPNVDLKSTISATAYGNNTASAKVVFNSYLDTTDVQFGTEHGSPAINLSSINAGTSQSGNTDALVNLSGVKSFSVTQIEQITLANGDKLTDGSTGTTVLSPAPASLLLVLSGLPLLGLASLRRRLKRAVA